MIDLDDLIGDDMFFEPMTVWRRQVVYDANGKPSDLFAFVDPQPFGSVQSGANPDLVRGTDYATSAALITVYTAFRLYREGDMTGTAPTPDGQVPTDSYGNALIAAGAGEYRADVIMFHGDPYEVFLVNDWTDYGTGFVQAVAHKITASSAALP